MKRVVRDSRGDLFVMVLAPNANLRLENIRDIIPQKQTEKSGEVFSNYVEV